MTIVETAAEPNIEERIEGVPEAESEVREEEANMYGDDNERWKDYNAPFKEFARAYVNLKSVSRRLGAVDENHGTVRPPFKPIDTLSWRL